VNGAPWRGWDVKEVEKQYTGRQGCARSKLTTECRVSFESHENLLQQATTHLDNVVLSIYRALKGVEYAERIGSEVLGAFPRFEASFVYIWRDVISGETNGWQTVCWSFWAHVFSHDLSAYVVNVTVRDKHCSSVDALDPYWRVRNPRWQYWDLPELGNWRRCRIIRIEWLEEDVTSPERQYFMNVKERLLQINSVQHVFVLRKDNLTEI